MARRKNVHIAAFQFEVKPNEIFICADSVEDTKRTCSTSTYIRSNTMPVKTGWVRIKQGCYIGNIALVQKETGNQLEVACVPGIPHALRAKDDELRLRPKRELITIDSIEELRRETLKIKEDELHPLTNFGWEGRTYENGLKIITLLEGKWTAVEAPSLEEVSQFLESRIKAEHKYQLPSGLTGSDPYRQSTSGSTCGSTRRFTLVF
ncbi:hypothetical protein BD410DRAFT_845326 [Rickenella mellea]|uniref:Uncharacterized protein n=1 Tax=Rickenella mellea TaxID=50990 RepID=A0A4Y7PJ92_9AGAM|nr:hypothetical protein BD410DRAFT_845326 [Rickenella mellea]